MKFPNVHNYIDYRQYFHDFYETNKVKGETISFRLLAKKLNWPFSYLSDVIHERKPLTISRALDFAKFAKMDSVGTERLIYMCFISFNNESIKDYFSEKLQKERNSDMDDKNENHMGGLENEMDTCIEELKGDLTASSLLKLLDLYQGKIKKEMVSKLLFSCEDLRSSEQIDLKLSLLEKNGNIKILASTKNLIKVKIIRPFIHFHVHYKNREIFALFTDNQSKLIRSKECAGSFNGGFIKIKREKYFEVLQKINQLRNWLLELDKESNVTDSINGPDTLLFQYGINLSALINVKALGYKNFGKWIGENH